VKDVLIGRTYMVVYFVLDELLVAEFFQWEEVVEVSLLSHASTT
jgi:hypothetical protein